MWRMSGVLLLVLASAAGPGLPSVAATTSLEEAEFANECGEHTQAALMRRDQLSLHMTAAQIEQAQELVRRCQQSQFKQCD